MTRFCIRSAAGQLRQAHAKSRYRKKLVLQRQNEKLINNTKQRLDMMTENAQTTAGGASTGTSSSGRQWLPAIARVLLGVAFLVFGLNGFLNFMPAPKDMPKDIMDVMGALMKAGYMKVVSGAEVIAALMLLTN